MTLIKEFIRKSLSGKLLEKEEIASLFKIPLFSEESAMIIAAARKKSESASNGLSEVHAQIGLNIAPCPLLHLLFFFVFCSRSRFRNSVEDSTWKKHLHKKLRI
jgi:hypothetical protein